MPSGFFPGRKARTPNTPHTPHTAMLWGPGWALWVLCLALVLAHRGNPPELRHQRVRRAWRAQGDTRVPSTEVTPASPFPPHTSHGGCGRAEAPQTRKMPPLGERAAPVAIQGFLGGPWWPYRGPPQEGAWGGLILPAASRRFHTSGAKIWRSPGAGGAAPSHPGTAPGGGQREGGGDTGGRRGSAPCCPPGTAPHGTAAR